VEPGADHADGTGDHRHDSDQDLNSGVIATGFRICEISDRKPSHRPQHGPLRLVSPITRSVALFPSEGWISSPSTASGPE
jgi:hypothetical protein